jgi:hypothetical protein
LGKNHNRMAGPQSHRYVTSASIATTYSRNTLRGDQQRVVAPVIERIRDTLKAGNRVWLVGGLPAPPSGTRVPTLPGAPLSEVKWSGQTYETVWEMQIARFLQEHTLQVDRIAVATRQPVNPFEDLSRFVLTNWRD